MLTILFPLVSFLIAANVASPVVAPVATTTTVSHSSTPVLSQQEEHNCNDFAALLRPSDADQGFKLCARAKKALGSRFQNVLDVPDTSANNRKGHYAMTSSGMAWRFDETPAEAAHRVELANKDDSYWLKPSK